MTKYLEEKLHLLFNLSEKALKINDDPLLRQVKDKCLQYTDISNNQEHEESLKTLLKEYAQIVLDFTYSDETKLVEEEFPADSCKERIQNIFVWIDTIEEAANKCLPSNTLVDCFGDEIVECIYWRKGALLYMLCSTIKGDENRKDQINKEFMLNVKQGIEYLEKMQSVRDNTTEWNGDQNVIDLANMGVYSDTHLLGMMYAGEMCYWYCQLKGEITPEFNPKLKGQDLLTKYIKTVKSPTIIGWSSDQAEEFLTYLNDFKV